MMRWMVGCGVLVGCGMPPTAVSVPATPVVDDADGDGVPLASDCDDTDPHVFPGAPERCNGVDDDCDPLTPDGPGAMDSAGGVHDDVRAAIAASTEGLVTVCGDIHGSFVVDRPVEVTSRDGIAVHLGAHDPPVRVVHPDALLSYVRIDGGRSGGLVLEGGTAYDVQVAGATTSGDGGGVHCTDGALRFAEIVGSSAQGAGGGVHATGCALEQVVVRGARAALGGGAVLVDSRVDGLVVRGAHALDGASALVLDRVDGVGVDVVGDGSDADLVRIVGEVELTSTTLTGPGEVGLLLTELAALSLSASEVVGFAVGVELAGSPGPQVVPSVGVRVDDVAFGNEIDLVVDDQAVAMPDDGTFSCSVALGGCR